MIEVACSHKSQLGEGPVWDEQTGCVYWVDIAAGIVHELNTLETTHQSYPIGQMTGAIALCSSGNLLVAAKQGPGIYNLLHKTFVQYPFGETGTTNSRFNDGKCDAKGRFWVGTMSLTEEAGAGELYCMDPRFEFKKRIGHLTIPNGMAWNSDHTKFYFIDTPSYSVTAYDFDEMTAQLSNGTTIISINDDEGAPDGMTIDNEGMLWIAHWDGWQVTRWNPVTGEKLLSVKLPVARVTSCTFGGKDFSDLYITTAYDRLNEKQLKDQPLAGALFIWKNCGFKGSPAHRFKMA